MKDEIVSTAALRREYGDVVAVKDIDLSVPRGAVMALVGPNGAGKSTLLKMLSAVLEPTRGTAVVNGVDINENPRGVHASVGFLPDFFGLYEEITVGEYLEYFARAYAVPPGRRESVIARTLADVDLAGKAGARVQALSRGMRQRLAIGRTLLHEPPLLLLDEPASGLDPESRHDLQKLFTRMAQGGKTLIVSSHILTELEDYCTHVAILREGNLVACGSLAEVRASVGRKRRVRVRAAGGTEGALALLRAAGMESPAAEGGSVFFNFSGTEEELSGTLKRLLDGGVKVLHFGEEGGGIQETYLASLEKKI
ncbi:MAG: ABC transporter ATP-binding protein [Elusimicrobiales bacterium]|nr:ABC transporter ATP-binding protein [Elusimicrobiales bacterium]